MTKRDGNASDHLHTQAAASPQDELVAGSSEQPESIHTQALLAQALERANLQRALKQVRQNEGAPGIDGMTVDELPDYLRHHWPEIRARLQAGHYCPQPVKRVEIPKPDGKTRPLGIPTVLDELDWELDRRGHRFARYADDCNILVKSKRAGERVMASVTRFVSDSLRLAVNPLKTMGAGRLPGTAQARGIGARSVEHRQIGPWSMAAVKDTGIGDCATIALLRNFGTTQPCATVGIQFIEPPDT
ncbi:MAG: hypothetical protein ACOZB1_17965 [Pseudomonadota bacterium]